MSASTSQPDSGSQPSERVERAEPAGPVTVIVLTEEGLKPVDVDKIVGLHQDEVATYRVLVPANTERNMLATFLNHLSLFEMREALESLRPIDRADAHLDAEAALAATLAQFELHDVTATGEITADDPIPALEDEVSRLQAREVVIVTQRAAGAAHVRR